MTDTNLDTNTPKDIHQARTKIQHNQLEDYKTEQLTGRQGGTGILVKRNIQQEHIPNLPKLEWKTTTIPFHQKSLT